MLPFPPAELFARISLTGFLKAPLSSRDFTAKTDANSFFSGASRSSVIQCKPGGNCPSRHRGMTRQLSPLSVAEDSAAPILELQNRSPSGICRHSRVERQSRSGRHDQPHPQPHSMPAKGLLLVCLLQRWGRVPSVLTLVESPSHTGVQTGVRREGSEDGRKRPP